MNIRDDVVGVAGFEPTASWSRTKRATICATPRNDSFVILLFHGTFVKFLFRIDQTEIEKSIHRPT